MAKGCVFEFKCPKILLTQLFENVLQECDSMWLNNKFTTKDVDNDSCKMSTVLWTVEEPGGTWSATTPI